MSTLPIPRGNFTPEHLDLVRRQIRLWETNDHGAEALADWLPDGVLTAPRGVHEVSTSLREVVDGWHLLFTDLHVELTSLFASSDGRWLSIEWTWQATRKSDGASGTTPDAIVVELRDGKIASWREYFDTFGSIEF